jgi:NAD-dependent deacetylase
MDENLKKAVQNVSQGQGKIVVLTGAGISAESGIPTFRGPEGFWTVGSTNYRPEEMATFAMFSRNPEIVWQWYLYRIGICRNAEPNAGHTAVVNMEKQLGDRFLLITQNVDGLHLKAGNSPGRTFQIHGNIETLRCSKNCSKETYSIPESVGVSAFAQGFGGTGKKRHESINSEEIELLKCPKCQSWLRPHVLWFDECYDEENYRFNSSIDAATNADMLLVVGTSGATNLPMQVGSIAAQKGAVIIDINPDFNPFSAIATKNGGFFLQGPAGQILPDLVELFSS